MKEWQRNLALLGVFAVGIGIAGFFGLRSWASQSYDETKSAETANVKTINIEGYAADVRVTPGPDSQATAHFYGKGRSDAYHLEVATSGDTLRIVVDHPDQMWNFGPETLTLDVIVPQRDFDRLTVNTASGDIRLQDLKSKTLVSSTGSGNQEVLKATSDSITLDTASGNITVEDTSATLDLKTASGDIIGHRLAGKKVSANCASGNVKLDGLTGEINARVMSGNIDLNYDKLGGPINSYTASGDVNLSLPADSSFNLNYKSTSGDLNSNFTMSNMSTSNRLHTGTIGSGGTAVAVETVSGNLTLHKK